MALPHADALREKAAEILRAAVRETREAERAFNACSADQDALALASVESLETLADTVTALLPQMPDAVRSSLELAVRAAWERLEAAGVLRDGAVGEPIDLERHRVIKSASGRPGGREVVASVVATGVLFKGRRVRVATVSAASARD